MAPEFNIVISINTAMCKWLNVELPRIPSPDGKRIGTQPLISTESDQCWQLKRIPFRHRSQHMIVAVEESSRYTLTLAFQEKPTLEEIEEELLITWVNHMISLFKGHKLISNEDIIVEQIQEHLGGIEWINNTNLSLNHHTKEAEYIIEDYAEVENKYNERLNPEDLWKIDSFLNRQVKSVKSGNTKRNIISTPNLISDMIDRLNLNVNSTPSEPQNKSTPNNVVNMADYRKG